MPTLGGLTFWIDVAEIGGWRMQRNIFIGHWRLLDPRNVRRAWGVNERMVDIFTMAAQAMKTDEGEVANEQEEDGVSTNSHSVNVDIEAKETDSSEET